MPGTETEKENAAIEAIKHVEDGMLIGIGTGSTVAYFIDLLAEKIKNGTRITGVPTSKETESKARERGIPVTMSPGRELDITFDGADEADMNGDLVKGGGGALLREKIIAFNSREMYVLVDSSKLKPAGGLGDFPLPIEIIPFLEERTKAKVEELGGSCIIRGSEKKFITDNGNYILDCNFGRITDPSMLESRIKSIPGVVEAGLFCRYAKKIFEGTQEGCRVHDIR